MSLEVMQSNPMDEVGLDIDVVDMIRRDLDGGEGMVNPENASIWAELISEAAIRALGVTSLRGIGHEFYPYLRRNLANTANDANVDFFVDALDQGAWSVRGEDWVIEGDDEVGVYLEEDNKEPFYSPELMGEWMGWKTRYENARRSVREQSQQYLYEDMPDEEVDALVEEFKAALHDIDAARDWRLDLMEWDAWGGSRMIAGEELPIKDSGEREISDEQHAAQRIIDQAEVHRRYKDAVLGVIDRLGSPDVEIATNRARYGTKAANLMRMDMVFKALIEAGFEFNGSDEVVPNFTAIDVSAFDTWRTGGEIRQLLEGYAAWMSYFPEGSRFMTRSSAVYSEDGETTGAGIYESVLVDETNDIDSLQAAVIEVYKSVNSDVATAYRSNRGISEYEKMGIVLQVVPRIPNSPVRHITIDTLRPDSPKLATYREDVRWSPTDKSRDAFTIIMRRQGMLREMGVDGGSAFDTRFHTAPDVRLHETINSLKAARLASITELAFGRPVQVELVALKGSDGPVTVHLVQARPLPEALTLNGTKFNGFPDESNPPVFHGSATAVINGTKAIITNGHDLINKGVPQSELPVLLMFDTQMVYSAWTDAIRREILSMPEAMKGRTYCLIANRAQYGGSGGGHLEMLMPELGVPLIFNDRMHDPDTSLKIGTKVKIYSDGVVAKLYGATPRRTARRVRQ